MNKKIIIFIILISLIVAGGAFWRWQGGKEEIKKPEEKTRVSVSETTKALGKIIVPKGASPESFEIIGLMETATPDNQGNFYGKIYKEGVTSITAMPKSDKGHELKKIVIASGGETETPLILDFKSTAVAIVFETPYFITNEPKEAKEILNVIENDPKVQEFAKSIEKVFSEENFLDDPTYQQSFKEAVESVLTNLNP